MEWSEVTNQYISELNTIKIDDELKQRIVAVIDYTSLNESDTEQTIASLCEQVETPYGFVAGLCVGLPFVRMVKASIGKLPLKAITVANFPEAQLTLEEVLVEIGCALRDGADEIDVVFPYHRYLAGERRYAQDFVTACKTACGPGLGLKIILETGILADLAIIADAAHDALSAGADFVKTSTGKNGPGASLEAAATLLLVVKHVNGQTVRPLGVKVSGGIKTLEQAAQYISLADHIMGPEWVSPHTFRIGTSKLVDELSSVRI
ncbi:MAG: deoxyribose-phosphate aldolase [Gammaproteobacteria bacterium]|nr:deoxyribose-phosphate aldolase [Gammaproteobacteria bacterium]